MERGLDHDDNQLVSQESIEMVGERDKLIDAQPSLLKLMGFASRNKLYDSLGHHRLN